MPLFEVAVLSKPSKKESDEGRTDALLLPPTAVVAKDAQGAVLAAAAKAPEVFKDLNLERVEVLVRPFD